MSEKVINPTVPMEMRLSAVLHKCTLCGGRETIILLYQKNSPNQEPLMLQDNAPLGDYEVRIIPCPTCLPDLYRAFMGLEVPPSYQKVAAS
ncbi:MAG: hypothetical protein IT292_07415 [Deltaproteobacteria bacterium]|nr:hypothetical protein [Deltaproteobacteria bacterium]